MKYFIICVFLIGCHPVQIFPHKTPAGQNYYKVECKGTQDVCYKQASVICNGGNFWEISKDNNNMIHGHTRMLFNWCNLTFVCGSYKDYVNFKRSENNMVFYDEPNKSTKTATYLCNVDGVYTPCDNPPEQSSCYSYGDNTYCK